MKQFMTELEDPVHVILPEELPGVPSLVQGDFDFDIDPRMTVVIERTGLSEDIVDINFS